MAGRSLAIEHLAVAVADDDAAGVGDARGDEDAGLLLTHGEDGGGALDAAQGGGGGGRRGRGPP